MLRKVCCVVSIAAQVAAAGSLPHSLTRYVYPATVPSAPIYTFTATAVPLKLHGVAGDELAWLKSFDVPSGKFQYTMQLIEDDEEMEVYRLVFDSPFKSPFPQNNIVPAEYYAPKHRDGKVPAAIVLDIMYGNAIVPRSFARSMASQGVAALYIPMAYYSQRRPKDKAHERWIEQDPSRVIDPPRQTVMDVRRAKAILASRPEVDSSRIGITGVSLGGIVASIAAGVDGEFYRVAPILAGGNLAQMIFHAPETHRVRDVLRDRGIDQQQLEKIMRTVDPLSFASRIDPRRCLMINAANDEVIPKDCTLQLWQAAGKPTLLWLPSGHYTAAWYVPTIKQTAIDFLVGKSVTQLEW